VHTAPPTVLPVVPRTALFAPVFTRTDFSHANFLFHHHVVFRGSFVNERPIEKIPVKRDPNVGSKFLAMVKKSTQSENSITNKENKEQPLILFAPPNQPNQLPTNHQPTNHQPTNQPTNQPPTNVQTCFVGFVEDDKGTGVLRFWSVFKIFHVLRHDFTVDD